MAQAKNKPRVKSTYYTGTPDGIFIFSKTLLLLFLIAKRAREENNYLNVEMAKQTSTDGPPHQTEGDLDELLQDYKSFHDSWVERCKRLHGKPYGC